MRDLDELNDVDELIVEEVKRWVRSGKVPPYA